MTDEKKVSILQRVLSRTETAIKIGSEISDVLSHMNNGITGVGALAIGLKTINAVRNLTDRDASSHFEEWDTLEAWGYEKQLYRACGKIGRMTVVAGVIAESAYVVEIDGVTIGWEHYKDGETYGPYVTNGTDHDIAYAAMGRAMWHEVGSRAEIVIAEGRDGSKDVPKLQTSLDSDRFACLQGTALLERTQKFIAQGMNRSILLTGPAGTGKSCMMRYIAHEIGGFQLRVPTSAMNGMSLRMIQGAVKILRPDTVLIDDFDRFCTVYNEDDSTISFSLEMMEYISGSVKVLVVSSNYTNKFPKALLRPGRFDEIEIVKTMDPGILDEIIGDESAEIRKQVLDLPVAFVVEFAKRKRVIGSDNALAEMKELRSRAGMVVRQSRIINRKARRTPAQQARDCELAAARFDLKASSLVVKAEKKRARAEVMRQKAVEQKAIKEKKEKAKKENAKKKSKKRAKTNPKKKSANTG